MNNEIFYWDKLLWQERAKEAKVQRELEWLQVENNLKIMNSTLFKGRYLAAHKKLFFKGDIAEESIKKYGGKEFEYALPWFVIWYHPELNKNVIKSVINWHCSSFKHALNISKIRELIERVCSSYGGKFNANYGLMGGREKAVMTAFWGSGSSGAEFDKVSDPLRPQLKTRQELLGYRASRLYWASVNAVLINSELHRHSPGQYLTEYAKTDFDEVKPLLKNTIKRAASNCIYFDKSKLIRVRDSFTVSYRDALYKKYQNRGFPSYVLKIWDSVKDGDVDFGE